MNHIFHWYSRGLLFTLLAVAAPAQAAGPICICAGGTAQTIREELEAADVAVLVKFVGLTKGANPDSGSGEYEVLEVLKSPAGKPVVKPGDRIAAIYFGDAKAREYLMLGSLRKTAGVQWKAAGKLAIQHRSREDKMMGAE